MPASSIAFLLLLFVGLPVLQARTHRQMLLIPRADVYVSASVSLWMLAALLAGVLWLEGQGPASIGLRGLAAAPLAGTSAVALAASLVLVLVARKARRALGRSESAAALHLIPETRREKMLLVFLVSPSAGIVEETVYRGFAVTRLAPLVGGPWVAAVLVAVAFAFGHVYQGPLGAVRAGVLGLVLAVPFLLTGSLLPSILAHAAIDAVLGIWLARLFVDDRV